MIVIGFGSILVLMVSPHHIAIVVVNMQPVNGVISLIIIILSAYIT